MSIIPHAQGTSGHQLGNLEGQKMCGCRKIQKGMRTVVYLVSFVVFDMIILSISPHVGENVQKLGNHD